MANKDNPLAQGTGCQQTVLLDKVKAAAAADLTTIDNSPPQVAARNEEQAFSHNSEELEKAVHSALIQEAHARTASHQADTWIKTWLAPRVFRFMQAWCSFVAIMFLTYFFLKDGDVPSEVMIALLTTTTVSIVGLVGFLVQGLFKSRDNTQSNNGS